MQPVGAGIGTSPARRGFPQVMVVEPHPPIEVPEGASDSAPKPARRRRDPANWTLAAGFAVVATVIGLVVLAWFVLYVTKGRFLKPTFISKRLCPAQKQAEFLSTNDRRELGFGRRVLAGLRHRIRRL